MERDRQCGQPTCRAALTGTRNTEVWIMAYTEDSTTVGYEFPRQLKMKNSSLSFAAKAETALNSRMKMVRFFRRVFLVIWLPLAPPYYLCWALVYATAFAHSGMKRDWAKFTKSWNK